MKKIFLFLFLITFLTPSSAQKICSSDISNFWIAFDSLQKTDKNKREILNALFLNKKSDGLKSFMEIKNFGEDDYLYVMEKYPLFWNSIRANTIVNDTKIEKINKALKKLKKLYPHNLQGTIYFTLGTLKSGGTATNEDLLLGLEKIVGDKNTIVSEFENNELQKIFSYSSSSQLEQVTVHETVHLFQKEGEINVLAKAIKEGSCDFIAELTLNKKFTAHYINYGITNNEAIMSAFKQEMFSQNFSNWFYNYQNSKHPDLGYYVGYIISKKYYKNASHKKQAIKDIIDLDFNDEKAVLHFLEKSKYFKESIDVEQIKSTYKSNQPQIIRIQEFENGSENVSPDINKIQIVFSKPMQENISINFSKFGKEHFPLQKILGLNDTKTILTIETIALKPDTEYDFYITDRSTKSIDGYPFGAQEYKIAFKTK
ncbi:hypothetical protein [Flavobacterium soli]|uniref:hypothetical protein n=1 Tax=Flavobacterium soli TaxID=344881 RepID=UPI00041BBC0C|nr:hypothetical protein [Flavobacterium soli]